MGHTMQRAAAKKDARERDDQLWTEERRISLTHERADPCWQLSCLSIRLPSLCVRPSARLPICRCSSASVALKGSTNCRPFRMLYEQSVHLPVRKCCRLSCDEEEASFNTFYKLASNQFGNLRIGRRFNENREIRGPWNSLLTLQNMYNMVSIIGHQSYAQLPLACAKLILIWAISIGSAASSLALLLII